MGLGDSRSIFSGFTDVDLMGIGGFPFIFHKIVLRSTRITSSNFTRVTPGRKWPEWVAYRRRRGLLGIPGHLPVVYGGVGPVHPVVIVDFVRILAELIKLKLNYMSVYFR